MDNTFFNNIWKQRGNNHYKGIVINKENGNKEVINFC